MRKISDCYEKDGFFEFPEKGNFYTFSFAVAIKLEREEIQLLRSGKVRINSKGGYNYKRTKKNI